MHNTTSRLPYRWLNDQGKVDGARAENECGWCPVRGK